MPKLIGAMDRRSAAFGERTYTGAVLNATVPEEFLMAIA